MSRSFPTSGDYLTWALTGNAARPAVISAWVYIDSSTPTGYCVNVFETIGTDNFGIHWDNATTKFQARLVGSATLTAAQTGTASNGWHHVICFFDDSAGGGSDTVYIIVDGVLGGSTAGTVSGMGTLARLNMGSGKSGSEHATGCRLADVAAWINVSAATGEPAITEIAVGLAAGLPPDECPGLENLAFWSRLINTENVDIVNKASPTVTGSPGLQDNPRGLRHFRRLL